MSCKGYAVIDVCKKRLTTETKKTVRQLKKTQTNQASQCTCVEFRRKNRGSLPVGLRSHESDHTESKH